MWSLVTSFFIERNRIHLHYIRTLFLFMAKWHSIVWISHILSVNQLIDFWIVSTKVLSPSPPCPLLSLCLCLPPPSPFLPFSALIGISSRECCAIYEPFCPLLSNSRSSSLNLPSSWNYKHKPLHPVGILKSYIMLGMMAHTYHLSIPKTKEGGLWVVASLGYIMRPYLKKGWVHCYPISTR